MVGYELQYQWIERKIIIEKYIEEIDGDLYDYKFHCITVRYVTATPHKERLTALSSVALCCAASLPHFWGNNANIVFAHLACIFSVIAFCAKRIMRAQNFAWPHYPPSAENAASARLRSICTICRRHEVGRRSPKRHRTCRTKGERTINLTAQSHDNNYAVLP